MLMLLNNPRNMLCNSTLLHNHLNEISPFKTTCMISTIKINIYYYNMCEEKSHAPLHVSDIYTCECELQSRLFP